MQQIENCKDFSKPKNNRVKRRRNVVNANALRRPSMLEFVWTVEEAAAFIGVSRGEGYKRVNSGEFPVIEIANRVVIPKRRFLTMLERGKYAADKS